MDKKEARNLDIQKCCICGNNLDEKRETLLIGENGEPKDVCEICALYLDYLESNTDKTKVNEAIAYFDKYINYVDRDTKECLRKIMKEKNVLNNPGGCFAKSSSWVGVLRAVAWLAFWGIIIAGIVMGVVAREMGFVIFLVYLFVAILSVSWTMVFLDLADDVRAIRREMEQKK